jgi:hypothetical protein
VRDDSTFEARLAELQKVGAQHPQFVTRLLGDFEEYCAALRRRRELARIYNPTAEDRSELVRLRAARGLSVRRTTQAFASLGSTTQRQVRALMVMSVVVVLAALMALAFIEAGAVRDGQSPTLHDMPLFRFDARPVRLVPFGATSDDVRVELAARSRHFHQVAIGARFKRFEVSENEMTTPTTGSAHNVSPSGRRVP